MQLVTDEIKSYIANSSWIRRMFETGLELKKQYGSDNVYDFSLGNPDLPPPPEVKAQLVAIAQNADKPFALGYMPNAGFPELRAKVAAKISAEQECVVPADNVILTCGAAGAINLLFRTILQHGDVVLAPAPYFVEYDFYAGNFGGKLRPVKTKEFTFELDPAAFEAAITAETRAIIINSPNNPTGQIYSRSQLEALAKVVNAAEDRFGRPIFIVSDEPYRFLNFDHVEIPGVFNMFRHVVVIGSYSKSLSLAGARIGFLAVTPNGESVKELVAGLIMANRILGFVNAPSVAQQILSGCIDAQVDLNIYRERRDLMARVLTEAGIEFTMPRGAFYFFPKSPVADESVFINALLAERVLAVPGRGFGCPGYFRLAFCVDTKVIANAAPGIKQAVQNCKKVQ